MKKMIIASVCALLLISCSYHQADKVAPLENVINMWQINNTFNDKVLDYYGSVFRGNEKGVDFNFTALEKGKTSVNFALIKYNDTTEVKEFIIDVK